MPQSLPNFVVAGAARSGTTGLVEGLRSHPDVFVTQPKEPHYFALHGTTVDFGAPGDETTINRVAVTDRAAYLDLYRGSEAATCRGDGSVSTLYYFEQSIPELQAINPEMRVVIILREPVDRAFSSFQYMRTRGFETEEDFLSAVDLEPARQADNWHHLWHYTQMSYYAASVSAFLERHGRDKVGVWFYDELQSDYEDTVSQVLRFLGAAPVEGEAAGVPRVNISGTPRSASVHRLIQAATRNEAVRRTVKAMTSYRLRELVRRTAFRPDGVSPEERRALAPRFAEDLSHLAAALIEHPRPVPDWLRNA